MKSIIDYKAELNKLKATLQKTLKREIHNLSTNDYRQLYVNLHEYFHKFEEITDFANKKNKEVISLIGKDLFGFSYEVFEILERQPEPCISSLKDYDHLKYGPFLGVSDEGSAASTIRQAAFATPKIKVLKNAKPIQVGVACDAERLAAVGEVAVGPDEYIDIRLKCVGSILTSTNVGTRLNVRYSKTRPIVYIRSHRGKDKDSLKYQKPEWEALKAFNKIKEILTPFIFTPDKNPRPLTILIYFWFDDQINYKKEVLFRMYELMKKDSQIKVSIHKIALLQNIKYGSQKVSDIIKAIDLLAELKIGEIAISGSIRYNATSYISLQGVLNYLGEDEARKILPYANDKGILVSTRELIDAETVARNIWTGLHSAHMMGLELGKYGLFPLTLEEVKLVTERIQGWFSNWTAAPVLYIDYPILSNETVYGINSHLVEGIKLWIRTISKNRIPVILIDTADKSKGYKLVKKDSRDKLGLLTLKQINGINDFAAKLNVKTLWAGGIKLDQIFEFGKMKVFGIYVTSSASTHIAVSDRYKDENMAIEKEPTFEGVFNSKVLLEAGFLCSLLINKKELKKAEELKNWTKWFVESVTKKSDVLSLDELLTNHSTRMNFTDLLLTHWKEYFKCNISE